MNEQTAVEGTQVERLQQSLKWFVEERDYFEKSSAQHYDLWQDAQRRIKELESTIEQLSGEYVECRDGNLGQRLKEHRKSASLTLAELKEKTELSISYLSDLERGRTNPSLETLKKLAVIYETTASSILEGY